VAAAPTSDLPLAVSAPGGPREWARLRRGACASEHYAISFPVESIATHCRAVAPPFEVETGHGRYHPDLTWLTFGVLA
jgi:hypothetical protein